ncbi:hypothetical protein [Xenococcus sp. PCC 7305]|uniref:hypothetical protein n=1 Tax=Xenococcus sp. PCC 7305 TaxID=102125 RepID=UPI0002EE622B|nr:hypothetical protein [Xenococcus sp. PCC 7305]
MYNNDNRYQNKKQVIDQLAVGTIYCFTAEDLTKSSFSRPVTSIVWRSQYLELRL